MNLFPVLVVASAWLTGAGPVVSVTCGAETTQMVNAALEADRGPGMQIAVIKDGKLLCNHAAGLADVENSVRMDTGSRLRIGSLSKLYTSALALRLAQKGILDLDESVRSYVGELPEPARAITPRHLGTHTSGIRHYDFENFAEANNTRYYESLADALHLFIDDPLLSEPGTEHLYSSFAYNLLGVVAERASNKQFPELLTEELLQPLGLGDTLPDHPLAVVPRRADFYTVLNGQLVNTFWRDSSDYYPSGGMLSTAADVARFTHAIFEEAVLDEKRRKLVATEFTLNDGSTTGYSFGWQVSTDKDGNLAYHHGGETNGAYAYVIYRPDTRLIVAGITNYNVFPDQDEVAFFDLVTKLSGRSQPASDAE